MKQKQAQRNATTTRHPDILISGAIAAIAVLGAWVAFGWVVLR